MKYIVMKYFLIQHEIENGDKYVSSEFDMNLELVLQKKQSPKTYYQGTNDTDYISGCFGVSEKAKDFFKSLTNPNIEFTPATVYHIDTDEPLNIYLMKVNVELDCIDYEKSELFVLSDKQIRGVDKMVFNTDINEDIFTVKNLSRVFINEELKDKIISYNLKGFRFVPIEKFTF